MFNLFRKRSFNFDSSFIKSIEFDGNVVRVTFQKKPTIYNYEVDNVLRKFLVRSLQEGQSAGKVYNKFLKGHSVSKTVFPERDPKTPGVN